MTSNGSGSEAAAEVVPRNHAEDGLSLVTVVVGLLGVILGGGAGYFIAGALMVEPLHLTVQEEKRAAGAARLEVKHTRDMLDAVREENDKLSQENLTLTEELHATKRQAFESKKALAAMRKERDAALRDGPKD